MSNIQSLLEAAFFSLLLALLKPALAVVAPLASNGSKCRPSGACPPINTLISSPLLVFVPLAWQQSIHQQHGSLPLLSRKPTLSTAYAAGRAYDQRAS